MDKRSIAILLIASSFATSSFAASTISKLITKHRTPTTTVETHKMNRQANQSYTDFSGTWLVNCGGEGTATAVIENDANYIKTDGVEYRIGQGITGQTESNEYHISSENMSYEWNEDRSALIIKSVNIYKAHADNSPIQSDIFKSILTMKDGQINLDGKWTMFEDVNQIEQPMTVHCVFTKKK